MKFAWIRYVSLLLVLCVSVCLMSSFVFASSADVFELTFTYDYDDWVYYTNSDSSVVDLAVECFNNKWPTSIVLVGLGDFPFDPSNYYSYGHYLYFTPSGDAIQIGVDLDSYDIISSVPLGVKEMFNLPDTLSGSFSYDIPPSPSSGFLSDLRLTGTSFLQTVQGIVLTIGKNPLLLLTVGIFIVGGCIAIFSRLLSKN